jgi:hypothetical protein
MKLSKLTWFVLVMLLPIQALAHGPVLEMMAGFGTFTVGIVAVLVLALTSIIKIPKETGKEERRRKMVRALTFFAGNVLVIFALVSAFFFIWVQS